MAIYEMHLGSWKKRVEDDDNGFFSYRELAPMIAKYVREMGYTQNAIAKLMGVSQGTVSNMIKEFELQTKIRNLQKDLDDARAIIEKQNLLPQNEDYFC
jgi:DNA-binding MarR family transcriptional regulator